ncbi:hypothetical protein KFK09_010083 [Dendrobium nobile]|uniref:Uncharacterized protein n=1 Tax=Dendrobium nobile TaxID=94219 RepID=A0A8T3BMW6_DENNO|nr:hypothetical protein KFK09_010083 [Dendrobium nobile]
MGEAEREEGSQELRKKNAIARARILLLSYPHALALKTEASIWSCPRMSRRSREPAFCWSQCFGGKACQIRKRKPALSRDIASAPVIRMLAESRTFFFFFLLRLLLEIAENEIKQKPLV